MDKYEVAHILREIGLYIFLTDKNPKKGLSYKKAAKSVEAADNFEQLVINKELTTLPGVGEKISGIIEDLITAGHSSYYINLQSRVPFSLFELLQIPGLTLRKIRVLFENLQISSIAELEKACLDGRIDSLKGFGKRSAVVLLRKINFLKQSRPALLWAKANNLANSFIKMFLSLSEVEQIEVSGELRRKMEIVNQLDFIIQSNDPENVIEKFVTHSWVKTVLNKNGSESLVLLRHGINAHLSVSSKSHYPTALLIGTGSQDHIHQLDKEARKLGFELSESSYKSEKDIYKKLAMQFVPPEIREDNGEIDAAKKSQLPRLIELDDLQGAFHCHTKYSDGKNSIEEMAQAAKDLGWQYIGISDHSKSSFFAKGMKEDQLIKQVEEIRSLNSKDRSFYIFSGVECDILKDGSLDYSNDLLELLDFVVISVHSLFKMGKEEMTSRFIKAIEHPSSTIVGHLTGRILLRRASYELDVTKVIDACIANNKVMELNAYPDRLDMDWRYWKKAKEKGLKCSINPDAHSIYDLSNCLYGINMARKGWLESKDVINTLSLAEMKEYLRSFINR